MVLKYSEAKSFLEIYNITVLLNSMREINPMFQCFAYLFSASGLKDDQKFTIH